MRSRARLEVAFAGALGLYLVALTLPWYRSFDQQSFMLPGWSFLPVNAVAFLLLAFSWGERGRGAHLLLRDGCFLLVLLTIASSGGLGFGRFSMFRVMPHLRGSGVTWGIWLALAASVAAAVLATLVARGVTAAPAREAPAPRPLRAWAFVLPLLAVPVIELVPVVAGWYGSWMLSGAFDVSVLLAAWALLVRRGCVPRELGVRVARELGRLVALLIVAGSVFDLVTDRSGPLDTSSRLGLAVSNTAALIAWVAAGAWAAGGYRNLRPGRIPEILRVDRLGPEQ